MYHDHDLRIGDPLQIIGIYFGLPSESGCCTHNGRQQNINIGLLVGTTISILRRNLSAFVHSSGGNRFTNLSADKKSVAVGIVWLEQLGRIFPGRHGGVSITQCETQ